MPYDGYCWYNLQHSECFVLNVKIDTNWMRGTTENLNKCHRYLVKLFLEMELLYILRRNKLNMKTAIMDDHNRETEYLVNKVNTLKSLLVSLPFKGTLHSSLSLSLICVGRKVWGKVPLFSTD